MIWTIVIAILAVGAALIGIDQFRKRSKFTLKAPGAGANAAWEKFKKVFLSKDWKLGLFNVFWTVLVLGGMFLFVRWIFTDNDEPIKDNAYESPATAKTTRANIERGTPYKAGERIPVNVTDDNMMIDLQLVGVNYAEATYYRADNGSSNRVAMKALITMNNGRCFARYPSEYKDGGKYIGKYEVVFDRDVRVIKTVSVNGMIVH